MLETEIFIDTTMITNHPLFLNNLWLSLKTSSKCSETTRSYKSYWAVAFFFTYLFIWPLRVEGAPLLSHLTLLFMQRYCLTMWAAWNVSSQYALMIMPSVHTATSEIFIKVINTNKKYTFRFYCAGMLYIKCSQEYTQFMFLHLALRWES